MDGQTEATVPVATKQNNANKGDLDFAVGLASESGAPIAGFTDKTSVKILDTENSDRSDLQKLVSRTNGHKREDYSAGWDAFARARAEAKKPVDASSSDKAAVSKAYVDLALAEKALVFKGPYVSASSESLGAGAPQIDKTTFKAKSIGGAEPELPTYVRVWFDVQVEGTPNSSTAVVAG